MAKYLAAHFVAAHQQVGSFEVINEFGVLQKNGGNVASYFCTPDGRVLHAVTGPVPARTLLAESHWAVETAERTGGDPRRIAEAHRDAARPAQGRGDGGSSRRIHQLLAKRPLPPLNDVYRTIFEDILGQRVSEPDNDLAQAGRAFAAAERSKLPILLILHKTKDNVGVLQEWGRALADGGLPEANPLTLLARSYVVIALPLNELPALSSQLSVPPYAAPDNGTPLFVIARSNARQLAAVTTWDKTADLSYAMAQGLVQEAKEHGRSPAQLRKLLDQVKPIDQDLGRAVLRLLAEARPASSRVGKSVKRP